MRLLSFRLMIAVALTSAGVVRAATITLQMVPVGDAGNVADLATGSLYGAVPYNYNIGKYDVTVGQYVAFLNSVATKSDPYGLYNGYFDLPTIGIERSYGAGSYSYTIVGSYSQAASCPIYDVTWGDACAVCQLVGQRSADQRHGDYRYNRDGGLCIERRNFPGGTDGCAFTISWRRRCRGLFPSHRE